MCSLGNFKLGFTLQRGHLYFCAQGGLNKGNLNSAKNIGIVTFEKFMGLDVDKDIQISGRAIKASAFTFSGKSKSGSGIHTGRDFYLNLFVDHDLTLAAAFAAGF